MSGGAMSDKKRRASLLQVASLLKAWPEPHGQNELNIKAVDLNDGLLRIAIEPSRSQCPCCLLDLASLRTKLAKKKGIDNVHIEVMGVPAANRWTKALNR